MTDTLIEAVARAMQQRCSEPLGNIPTLQYVPAGSLGDAWPHIARAAIAAIEASGSHRVVPVKITEDMACASECAWGTEAQWDAMLAAAPEVK